MSKYTHRLNFLLACGLPALLISLSAALLAYQSPAEPPFLAEVHTYIPDCASDAAQDAGPWQFDTWYPDDGISIVPWENGWRFMGRAWMAVQLCGPGTLLVRGIGQEAGEDLPRLEIGLNSEPLASLAFPAQGQSAKINVPHAGRLTVAYLNDYYLSEYRAVTLSRIQLHGADCPVMMVANGGKRSVADTPVTFILEPVILELCASGTLEMRVWAKAAQGVPPQLALLQGARASTQILKQGYQTIYIPVTSGEVKLSIDNPYAAELADRNIILQQLEFAPNER